ncbi:MAG: lipase maturation factor family protein [Acidobacteriota bacterium]
MPPLLIYDGKCGFCRIWLEYWRKLTGDRVKYAASQDVGGQFPQIPKAAFGHGVQLVRPDGSVASGARAVFETLGRQRLYESSPLIARPAEFTYGIIASNRGFFYWVTRILFGKAVEPARFALTQWLFLRGLAVVYAIAFASLGTQVTGLIGERGISPVAQFFGQVAASLPGVDRYFAVPSLLWLNTSDLILQYGCWLGFSLALVLLFARMERAVLIALYALYLSFCLAGQEFLLFQWDALLLETGFLAIFFGRTVTTQRTLAWLFRWLVFRLYFLSGWVKIDSGDPTWLNFTALDFHYWTQPLPNRISWYAAQLPEWAQHASTFGVLALELAAPFLIFLPRRPRMLGAFGLLSLQALIFATGNYTFFNILAVALTLFLFDDQALRGCFAWLSQRITESRPSPRASKLAAAALTLTMLPLGLARLLEQVSPPSQPGPLERALTYTSPFQLVNSYGLFAVMTTSRPEIVVEGSNDGVSWQAYEFRYKPGDVNRAPPFVAPHQPRLDWQMWFAVLSDFRNNLWFLRFVDRLLEGSPGVTALLEKNPFAGRPPQYIRAQLYEYRFTSSSTLARTGAWWTREFRGEYLPAVGRRTGAAAK